MKERKIVVETEEMGDDKETLQALMDKGKRAKISFISYGFMNMDCPSIRVPVPDTMIAF